MMRDKYVAHIDTNDVLVQMFWDSVTDHNVSDKILGDCAVNKDELRCAITVFCNDIKNYLIDYYNVDLDEVEEQAINEDPHRCIKCKYSEVVVHCIEHGIDVHCLDGCSDWEERGE